MTWADLKLRLRALVFPDRADQDLDEELQFHLAMQARKHQAAGLPAPEAERRARRQFGGVQQVAEACRDARGVGFIDTLSRDARYAIRGFLRTPEFALTVVAIIGLGLGLNTAVFTAFNAYVLRPLQVRDPHTLYEWSWINGRGETRRFAASEVEDFRRESNVFVETLASELIMTRSEGHVFMGQLVTVNYFQMLGAGAALGRTLLAEDVGAPVVVLSHAAWQNKFGADPAILGRVLAIRGTRLEVVGVAPPGFTGVGDIPWDFWAPMATASPIRTAGPDGGRALQRGNIRMVGRLRPGWSLGRTRAGLLAWATHEFAGLPAAERVENVDLIPRGTMIPLEPELVAAMTPVMAAFGLVLLIACANIANLMLARVMARQREIGIRLALGATRRRLVRQLLTESVLLALPAALLGFAVSQATIQACVQLLFATIPRGYAEFITMIPLAADVRVFGFMLAASIATALLFGLVPALQATRPNILQAARGEFTTDARSAGLRHGLVTAQVAVSAMFLIAAGVLLHANSRITGRDVGLRSTGVVEIEPPEQMRPVVLQRLADMPLVETVFAAGKVPFLGFLPAVLVTPAGSAEAVRAGYQFASPEYFTAFRIPIVRGRGFTGDEARSGEAVAVISERTAARLFPGRDPVGQAFHIRLYPYQRHGPGVPGHSDARVIGVVRDAINGWLGTGIDPTCIYLPTTTESPATVLMVRVKGDAEAGRQKLEAAMQDSAPGAIDQIHSIDEVLAAQRYPFRVAYWASAAMAALALALTLAGIYGVLSYLVTQRTREIGIRVALGAGTGRVVGLVMKQSLMFAAIGTAIGAAGGLGAAKLLALQVPDVDGTVGGALVLGSALVFAASACAAWIPSLRAARIVPMTTLRCD